MAALLPAKATVRNEEGGISTVPLEKLCVGQIALVKPGERIPADSDILEGMTTVNESLVTGESRDVPKDTGARVIGGSLNGSGAIAVRVTGIGESGYQSQVTKLVEDTQRGKLRTELLSDRVAGGLFYAALSVALIAFVFWFTVTRRIDTALIRMVTVLVIACPLMPLAWRFPW